MPRFKKNRVSRRLASVVLLSSFLAPVAYSQQPAEEIVVSRDLQMIYDKTDRASTVTDYSAILDFCRNVAGDSTRSSDDRQYARSLMSWAANRRGEARSDEAGMLVRTQQLEEAEELDELAYQDFELAIKLDKTRWRAHLNLAIVQAVRGDNPGAIKSLNEVIRLNPSFADAYYNRAEIYFRDGQFDKAIADHTKAIELDPDDSPAYSGRAHALYALGRTEEALQDYQRATELSPESAEVFTEYADTCQSLGKWKEAATAYQKALQLDKKNARALQNAAWMMATCPDDYFRDGENALETAQRAVQLASATQSTHTLDVLAAAQAAAGDFASAQSTISEAIRSTNNPTLRSELQARSRQYQRKRPYIQPAGPTK